MNLSHYPPSPVNVPKNFTSLTSSYQLRSWLAVLAVFTFFILYFALVAGMAYLVYYAFTYEMGSINRLTIFLKIGTIAGSLMLFAFTLKFIFKLKNYKPENRLKLKLKEHPNLKSFVEQICKETGAPKPKAVYIDPDVNAYVAYTNVWLSLVFPTRKDLTLGFGLTGALNLSEFKAVTAHEFGHFAQRSMKIGSYILSANTIIHDMIFSRDRWDILLDDWRQSDFRLAIFAWLITPVIWVIRQILNLFYQFLNVMYSSLSREMEFNADKYAVSVSGSDAIVSALWKLDNAALTWNNTLNYAYLAGKKQVFVKNLYAHNHLALERYAPTQKELFQGLPKDQRGGKKFFAKSEVSKVSMYASHPPNDLREENAKAPYVEGEIDERDPWVLFTSPETLQEELTALIYQQYLGKVPEQFSSESDFEGFIQAETQGKDLLEEYNNTFENRFIHIPDTEKLIEKAKDEKFQKADQASLDKLKTELNSLMQPIEDIQKLMLKAQQIAEGSHAETSLMYNGTEYKKKNLQDAYTLMSDDVNKLLEESFVNWDADFCTFHYVLAQKSQKTDDLTALYNQHKVFCQLYRKFVGTRNTIYYEVNNLQARGDDLTQVEINNLTHQIMQLFQEMNQEINKLDQLDFVPLPNIDNINELKANIIETKAFNIQGGNIFENGGFDRMMNELDYAVSHCQHLDQKSIAVILLRHKDLQEQWNTSESSDKAEDIV